MSDGVCELHYGNKRFVNDVQFGKRGSVKDVQFSTIDWRMLNPHASSHDAGVPTNSDRKEQRRKSRYDRFNTNRREQRR
ncbi:uncharacterized protein LOC113273972 isoform X2 [Papaver somniferum]|uniref:uncharacterized protein LOC113273972 isoform X2 n=1 Tax=Papaver somniferum TaxID=3469 RepID=UPI000E6FDE7B|nr:uncharacterized protein LOC113273972 isoform X2 [Papaver somniferum]